MGALLPAIAVVVAVVTTAAAAPLVRRLALAAGAVDGPDQRRPHEGPMPSLGGLALAAGICTGAIVLASFSPPELGSDAGHRWIGLAAGAAVLLAVGAWDDVRPLSPWTKLIAQIGAATLAVALGLRADAIVDPFGGALIDLGWLAAPLSAFWIVAAVNAFNLIDGLDGLCLGLAAMGAAALAVVAGVNGQPGALALLAIVAAASAGLLVHNWHPARMFLGDSGSLSLGFLLGAASLWAAESGGGVAPAPAILALAVPLADMATAVLRRLFRVAGVARHAGPERERFALELAGRPRLFAADRQHVHHRLLDRGYPYRQAVLILWSLGALGAAAAVAVAWRPALGLPVTAAAVGLGLYLVLFQLRYHELSLLRRGLLLPLFGWRLTRRRAFHALVDAALAAIAFAAAHLLARGGAGGVGAAELRAMLPAAVGVELIVFYLSGLYRGAYRHAGVGEALRVARSTALASVAAAAGLALSFGMGWSELGVYVLNGLLLLVLVLGSRVSFAVLDYLHAHGRDDGVATLLYGTGRGGDLALREMLANPSLGWRPIGFIDDMDGQRGRYRGGYPILGSLEDLPEIVQQHGVRQVVVTTRKLRPERWRKLEELCQRHSLAAVRFGVEWESVLPTGDGQRRGSEPPHVLPFVQRQAGSLVAGRTRPDDVPSPERGRGEAAETQS